MTSVLDPANDAPKSVLDGEAKVRVRISFNCPLYARVFVIFSSDLNRAAAALPY